MFVRPMLWLLVGSGAAVSGCGLISSDVTEFDLDLPAKTFVITPDDWALPPDLGTQLAATCANDDVCAQLAAAACAPNQCTGTCGTANTCELRVEVSLTTEIDLATEKPELASIEDRAVIEVTVDGLDYAVPVNTLNFVLPSLRIGVAATADDEATPIGDVPALPVGSTVVDGNVSFVAAGQTALATTMGNFRTPFNLVVTTWIDVTADDPAPTGRAEASVTVRAHAGL